MPVHKTKSGGYQWGKSGKVYKSKAKADSAMSKSCYYDSMHGTSDDKKY